MPGWRALQHGFDSGILRSIFFLVTNVNIQIYKRYFTAAWLLRSGLELKLDDVQWCFMKHVQKGCGSQGRNNNYWLTQGHLMVDHFHQIGGKLDPSKPWVLKSLSLLVSMGLSTDQLRICFFAGYLRLARVKTRKNFVFFPQVLNVGFLK